jgi:hypothetical protein
MGELWVNREAKKLGHSAQTLLGQSSGYPATVLPKVRAVRRNSETISCSFS